FRSITWTGSRFVAAGGYGVMASPDGETWTPLLDTDADNNYIRNVVSRGDQLIVLSDRSLVSDNGTNFTTIDMIGYDSPIHLYDAVWDGTQWVGTTWSPISTMTSADGQTWQPAPSAAAPNQGVTGRGITWNGNLYAIVGDSGGIMTSPDAVTWTMRSSGTTTDLTDVTSTGSLFVAVGLNGTILTSPDGSAWTSRNSGTSQSLNGITW